MNTQENISTTTIIMCDGYIRLSPVQHFADASLSLSLSDVFLVNADDAHEGKERERYRYDTAADVLLSVLTHGASLFYPF